MTYPESLNDVMQFDCPVRVHTDGTVTREDGVHAPNLYDEEIEGDGWEFFTHGYTGQHGYNGPIMHNSEFIGGRLEADILATPGVYVAVVAMWLANGEDLDEDTAEGWAVLRSTDKD